MDLILVNINKDIINRYVYIYKDKEKNSHKNIIEDKKKVLPQEVIFYFAFLRILKIVIQQISQKILKNI